ncbi:hypothetical protein V6N11_059171 [Hibiscus sabdariffa]|uniref:Uncharacterized protein n=1 Tax=Hibiscus sabdariffa TaxID=183260 RepID=A0ABR2U6K8_9ROSI
MQVRADVHPNSIWCVDEEESNSFTLDDVSEKQKLNDEFEDQGEESAESSTENLEAKKVATSLDKLDFFGNCKELTHLIKAFLVSNVIVGEDSASINLVTVDRVKVAQNSSTINFQEQNDVGIAMGVTTVDENPDIDSFQVEEDVRSMERGKHVSWADKVDRANSVNSTSVLFLEMQDFHCIISKKYVSILDLQDKAISAKEKKCRDRAINRNKRYGKENVILEVDASSPTNSDIARKHILTRSARKTLALGKSLGIEFIRDEEEILEDFIRVELQNS